MKTALNELVRSAVSKVLLLWFWLPLSRGGAAAAPVANTPENSLKRYLVFTETAASNAVARGARIVQQTKGL